MPKREITVQAAAAARFRVPNGSWIFLPFSNLARANSVTAEKPGNDIAYIDINNLGGNDIFVVLFDAVTAGTDAPNSKDLSLSLTTPAAAGGTMGTALRVDANASLTLDRFRGVPGVSLFASAAHSAEVEVVLTSYSNDTVAPWS